MKKENVEEEEVQVSAENNAVGYVRAVAFERVFYV